MSYFQTRPGLFKIAKFRRWMVLVAGPELIEDVRKAPENVLSRLEPIIDVSSMHWQNGELMLTRITSVHSTRIYVRLLKHE